MKRLYGCMLEGPSGLRGCCNCEQHCKQQEHPALSICPVRLGHHLDDAFLGDTAASVRIDKPLAAAHNDADQHVYNPFPKDTPELPHANKSGAEDQDLLVHMIEMK